MSIYFIARPTAPAGTQPCPPATFSVPEGALLSRVQAAVYARMGHCKQYEFIEFIELLDCAGDPIHLHEYEVCR